MNALRHILMSTGLHGVFAVVMAFLLFGAQAVQEHRKPIVVQLIEVAATPAAVEPAKSAAEPEPVVPLNKSVRPDPRRAQHVSSPASPRRGHHVSKPTSLEMQPVSPAAENLRVLSVEEPREVLVSPATESIPVFLEMGRHSRAAAPAATTAHEAMPSTMDTISSPNTLSITSIVPPLFRPILTGRTESRPVLRDSSAEKLKAPRSPPRPGENLRPDYPRTAQEAGWEGTVMLRVEVLPDGNTGTVSVQRTSGHAILDTAALTAVQRWRFSPAMDGNFPIRSVVHLPVKFDLMTP